MRGNYANCNLWKRQNLTINWGISVCVCVCVCVCPAMRFQNGYVSSHNLEWTFYGSWHGAWAIYSVRARNVRAYACMQSARACVRSLIFLCIISTFAGNILRITTSSMNYVLFMFKHCERACASERVVKRSLIFRRIISKFAENILRITTISMGYVLVMFTYDLQTWPRTIGNGVDK
jgi:hypothetical protein